MGVKQFSNGKEHRTISKSESTMYNENNWYIYIYLQPIFFVKWPLMMDTELGTRVELSTRPTLCDHQQIRNQHTED